MNIVKILVGYDANIAALGNGYTQETPLSNASERPKEPDSEIVKLLLTPVQTENTIRALEIAIINIGVEAVQTRLQAGIGDSLVARDRHGNTGFHRAAERYSSEMIQMLLQSGADFTRTNDSGWRPVHSAIRKGKN